jgi:hypothetical protein
MKKSALLSAVICLAMGVVVPGARPCWGQDKPAAQRSRPAQEQQGRAPAGPQVIRQQFIELQAIRNEQDPDWQTLMVTDFATKYPDSPLLSDVYSFGAYAAQQKGDVVKAVDFGEKSLKAESDNIQTLVLMASILSMPQVAQGADAENKLAEAETDANKVLYLLPRLPRTPNESCDRFQEARSAATAVAHAALCMVHLQRASLGLAGPDAEELSEAKKEYQMAESAPNPNPFAPCERPRTFAKDRLGELNAELVSRQQSTLLIER